MVVRKVEGLRCTRCEAVSDDTRAVEEVQKPKLLICRESVRPR